MLALRPEGRTGMERPAGGRMRTKILLGNEQGSWWSRDRVEGRKSQSGENAFIQQNTVEYPQGAKHRGELLTTKKLVNKVR